MTSQKLILTFIKKEEASIRDAYSFYFKRPPALTFLPGQYLRWTIEKDFKDDRGKSRYFTIASSPTEKDHLMLTTRILKSGFKNELINLNPNDAINTQGPFGNFILDEKDKNPRVFIAGGIGITPFRSMAVYARDLNFTSPIIFFSTFSTVEDIVYYQELKDIESKLPNYKFIVTITKPEESKTLWKGEVGRIDKEKLKKYINNLNNQIYYIAGPTKMVDNLKATVASLGVKTENIKFENFPGY